MSFRQTPRKQLQRTMSMDMTLRDNSLSLKKMVEPSYLVFEVDKKLHGILTLKKDPTSGIALQYAGLTGDVKWHKSILLLDSLVKVANSPRDVRLSFKQDEDDSPKSPPKNTKMDVLFRFLTPDSKLEMMVSVFALSPDTRILDDSVRSDGTLVFYKVQHITKATKAVKTFKTLELDFEARSLTRRGSKGVRDVTNIDKDFVMEVAMGSTKLTYSSPGKAPCACIFPSTIHVYDFVSSIIKVRERLPVHTKQNYSMAEFRRLSELTKITRLSLMGQDNAVTDVVDLADVVYPAISRFLAPIEKTMGTAMKTTPGEIVQGMLQYGLLKEHADRGKVSFTQNGCGSIFQIRTVTWNVGETASPDIEGGHKLLGTKNGASADVYAVGLQECSTQDLESYILTLEDCLNSMRPNNADSVKRAEIRNGILGHTRDSSIQFTTLAVQSMWKIHLILFVRSSLLPHVSHLSLANQPTGAMGMAGNKGGVGAIFRLFGTTSVSVITCHLAARHSRNKRRAKDFHNIVAGLSSKLCSATGMGLLEWSDHSFWFGDFNYRIDFGNHGSKEEFDKVVQMSVEGGEDNFADMIAHDQLVNEIGAGKGFVHFQEGIVRFPPTYRYERTKAMAFSNKRNQNPSYCDRVTWHSSFEKDIELLEYNSVPGLWQSDHKPVYAVFVVACRLPYLSASRHGHIGGSIGSVASLMISDISFVSSLDTKDEDVDDSMSGGIPTDDEEEEDEDAEGSGMHQRELSYAVKLAKVSMLQNRTSRALTTDSMVSRVEKQTSGQDNSKNFVNTLRKGGHRRSVFNVDGMQTTMTGWLFKKRQTSSFFKPNAWQKRWMELTSNYLIYKKAPNPGSPILASIDLRNVTSCERAEKNVIYLYSTAFANGKYTLKGSDSKETDKWFSAIQERLPDEKTSDQYDDDDDDDDDDDLYDDDGLFGDNWDFNKHNEKNEVASSGIVAINSAEDLAPISDDFEMVMNGRLCIKFESECLLQGQSSENIMPLEQYGHGIRGTLPLQASRQYIEGFSVSISNMEILKERDKSFMSYQIESVHELQQHECVVSRSFRDFKEMHALIVKKIPSIASKINGDIFTKKRRGGTLKSRPEYEEEREVLELFVQEICQFENVWSMPEFLQFLDDYVDFETEKVWAWDNTRIKPLSLSLHDSAWIKMQKIVFRLEDNSSSRIVGGSDPVYAVLALEDLEKDGVFSIPVMRHNIPRGVLRGKVDLNFFDPGTQIQKYMEYDQSKLLAEMDRHTRDLSSIKIRIMGTKLIPVEGSKAYTVYIIQVTFRSNEVWKVERRYSKFHDLHKNVVENMPYLKSRLPKFPDKKFLTSLTQATVQSREDELLKYMEELVCIPDVWFSKVLRHFLDNPSMVLLQTVQQLRLLRTGAALKQFPGSESLYTSRTRMNSSVNNAFGEQVASMKMALHRQNASTLLELETDANPSEEVRTNVSQVRAFWQSKDEKSMANAQKNETDIVSEVSTFKILQTSTKSQLNKIVEEEEDRNEADAYQPDAIPQTTTAGKNEESSASSRLTPQTTTRVTKIARPKPDRLSPRLSGLTTAMKEAQTAASFQLLQLPGESLSFAFSTNPVTGNISITLLRS